MKTEHQFQIQTQLKSTCLTQGEHVCKCMHLITKTTLSVTCYLCPPSPSIMLSQGS